MYHDVHVDRDVVFTYHPATNHRHHTTLLRSALRGHSGVCTGMAVCGRRLDVDLHGSGRGDGMGGSRGGGVGVVLKYTGWCSGSMCEYCCAGDSCLDWIKCINRSRKVIMTCRVGNLRTWCLKCQARAITFQFERNFNVTRTKICLRCAQ